VILKPVRFGKDKRILFIYLFIFYPMKKISPTLFTYCFRVLALKIFFSSLISS